MPVFQLPRGIFFPDPELAEQDGLLAVGGDLSEERLLAAYSQGIFPWYSRPEPILWWSPDPRTVLFPREFHESRSLRRELGRGQFHFTCDRDFPRVIHACARTPRAKERGTWILKGIRNAYISLHRSGWAHSVEAWQGADLVGGLYGVSLGKAFFGESMFFRARDASKAALFCLSKVSLAWGFSFIDCQLPTDHLKSLGAREISRKEYLGRLADALSAPTRRGCWSLPFEKELEGIRKRDRDQSPAGL